MPARVKKITGGKRKGRYKIETPGGVKARGTTKQKAEAQRRLLEGVKRGWKPGGRKKAA